jgi:CRISPR-associated endonuclease/helicase Cas3
MATDQKRIPYCFQREILRTLQEEKKSVIVQTPTGSGKTDGALQPFIQCLAQDGDWLPRTCLYATPMRVLSNQFYDKFHEKIVSIDKTRGTRLTEIFEKLKRDPVSIQTGEQPQDLQFESLLTFCTIDQLLASFLGVPYSIDKRKANLNVGAVIGSYLVFDEFHLYPLLDGEDSIYGARTTTLTMLRLLSSVTRFVLMTATFSTALVEELAQLLNAKVVKVTDDELKLIARGRQRTFEMASNAMNADTILAHHKHCSLVICNTVLRAQQQYWALKERAQERGIDVVLLHSRLTDDHRSERSRCITRELGQAPEHWKDEERYGWKEGCYYGKNLIVVATQVVEVGLDISVETLHSEIAPANSLIQRAGRCARFAMQEGQVIVYPLPDNDIGKPVTTLPYNKGLCEETQKALLKINPQQPVGFKEEQQLIDAVHTKEDKALLEQYRNQDRIEKEIFNSLQTNERGIVSTLIRDVAQVQVLIHDNPNAAIVEEPWRWQSFALHPGSLASRWQALEERAASLGLEWVCKKAELLPESEERDADSRQKARYRWESISSSGNTDAMTKTLSETLMVVLPTQLATYHDELGFVLLDGRLPIESTGYQSTPPPSDKNTDRNKAKYAPMKVESYLHHITGLMSAYTYDYGGIRHNTRYITSGLEERMNLPQGSIDQAICLAIACHDLGKLSKVWQEWAWAWQKLLYKQQPSLSTLPELPFFYAKTEFDNSKEQRDLQREMKLKRPNHACESVIIGREMIADSLGINDANSKLLPLFFAVCGAIARHHTPNAHTYDNVMLASGAEEAVKEALEQVRQNASWKCDLSLLETKFIKGGNLAPDNVGDSDITIPKRGRIHELETWLYFVIVRALRLADQRAGIRW